MAIALKDSIIIRFAIFIIYTTYSIPIPFLPALGKRHNLVDTDIGFILAAYAAGGYINLVLMGKYMRFINKTYALYIGWLFTTITTVGISQVTFFEGRLQFMVATILCRFIQGFSVQSCSAIFYSYILENCSEQTQTREIATINVFTTLGISFGPLLGGILNRFMSIDKTLLICGIIVGFVVIFVFMIKLSFKQEESQNESIQYSALFSNKNFTLTYILAFLQIVGCFIIITNFAQDLVLRFNLTPSSISLIYSLLPISSVLSSTLNSIWSDQYVQRPFGYLMSLILISLGVFIAAPQVDVLPSSCWFVAGGLFLDGFGLNYFTIIMVPEYIYIMKQIFKDTIDDDRLGQINDMASALFLQGFMIAELFGPIIGGVLGQYIGYQWATRSYIITLISFYVIYAIFGNQIFFRLKNFTKLDRQILAEEYQEIKHDSQNSSGFLGAGVLKVKHGSNQNSQNNSEISIGLLGQKQSKKVRDL